MNKYTWAQHTFRNFQIGMVFSLTLVIVIINWSVQPSETLITTAYTDPDEEITIIRTVQPSVKKKRLPPAVIKINDEVEINEPDEFVTEPVKETKLAGPTLADTVWKKHDIQLNDADQKVPVVLPPDPVEKDEPIIIAERMPSFGDCDHLADVQARKNCSDQALLEYIHGQVKYPELAKTNGIQGTVVARFIITKGGNVDNIELLKDPGAGCGAEVYRILRAMPTWTPGRQNGRVVPVILTLPVRFRLD